MTAALSPHDLHLSQHPKCQVCGEGNSVVVVGEDNQQFAVCVVCFSGAPPVRQGGWEKTDAN
jgi:hypothetical protein